jgi:hypothetical protein
MSLKIVLIGLAAVFMIAVVAFAVGFGPTGKRQSRDKALERVGVLAAATILDLTDTGSRYNKNPEVRLKLEIRPQNGDPYIAEVRTVISVVELPKYQPGATLRVKYDPENPSTVAIIPQ